VSLHPDNRMRYAIVIEQKPGLDMPPGTLNSILKQAGLK